MTVLQGGELLAPSLGKLRLNTFVVVLSWSFSFVVSNLVRLCFSRRLPAMATPRKTPWLLLWIIGAHAQCDSAEDPYQPVNSQSLAWRIHRRRYQSRVVLHTQSHCSLNKSFCSYLCFSFHRLLPKVWIASSILEGKKNSDKTYIHNLAIFHYQHLTFYFPIDTNILDQPQYFNLLIF